MESDQILPSVRRPLRRAELLYGGLRGVPHHGRHGSVHLVPSCTLAASGVAGGQRLPEQGLNGRVETKGGGGITVYLMYYP